MSQNPTITQLDSVQAFKRTYDESNDAIRTIPAESTSFAVELSADDGDSVLVVGNGFAANSATLTSASSGVVIAATSCVGTKSFQLYGTVIAEASGTDGDIVARVEFSPSDTDNVWSNSTSVTIAMGAVANSVTVGSIISTLIARRVRVSLTSNALGAADSVKFYLVGNSV